MNLPNTTFSQLTRDAQLLILSSGLLAISFFGIQMLLAVLYILRLGYSVEYVGLYNAFGALTYIVSSLPAGAIGARLGVRTAMIIGGSFTVLGMALLPTTELLPSRLQAPWPILAQVVVTIGWALISINQVPALMAVTTAQNRNSAYALNGVLRGLGTFVGTVVGGFLPLLFAWFLSTSSDAPIPYRVALFTGALLGGLALLPFFLIRPTPPTVVTARVGAEGAFPRLPVIFLVMHVFLGQMGAAACQSFCSAYMDTTLALSSDAIGLLTGVGQFTTILVPLLIPRLAARYGNGWILMMVTFGLAFSLLPLAFIAHWSAAGLGRLGLLALGAMWMPALQVFQMELVDSRWRALTYGIVSMAIGFSYATVGFGGGYLVAAWGYQPFFLLALGLSLVGALFMWGMRRNMRRLAVVPVQQ
ncbi:MAG: MFS transporter [Caldilineaceae bacterium]|nr:MFS transporter [Caldilineaceae bacterium]